MCKKIIFCSIHGRIPLTAPHHGARMDTLCGTVRAMAQPSRTLASRRARSCTRFTRFYLSCTLDVQNAKKNNIYSARTPTPPSLPTISGSYSCRQYA